MLVSVDSSSQRGGHSSPSKSYGMSVWIDCVDMEVELEWEPYEEATYDCPESGGTTCINKVLQITNFTCIDISGNVVNKERLAELGMSEDWVKQDILDSVQLDDWMLTQDEWAEEELLRIYGADKDRES